MDCKVCGKPDNEKPAIFKGEDYCCDDHRKVLTGELRNED